MVWKTNILSAYNFSLNKFSFIQGAEFSNFDNGILPYARWASCTENRFANRFFSFFYLFPYLGKFFRIHFLPNENVFVTVATRKQCNQIVWTVTRHFVFSDNYSSDLDTRFTFALGHINIYTHKKEMDRLAK